MIGELINLTDDEDVPHSTGMSPKFPKLCQRDSFSGLVDLMRAKKSFAPAVLPAPTPQPSLFATSTQLDNNDSISSDNVISPLPQPFFAPGSVAAFLHEQENNPSTSLALSVNDLSPEKRWENLQASWAQLQREDGDTTSDQHFGPVNPPTPSESVPHPLSSHHKEQLDNQIGRLRYQCEANKEQKAAMGRSMRMLEEDINNLTLDRANLKDMLSIAEVESHKFRSNEGEIEYLHREIQEMKAVHQRAHADLVVTNHTELEVCKDSICSLKAQISHYADILSKKENIIMELRQKYGDEQVANHHLRDEIERLTDKVKQEDMDAVKTKLREKTSQCDRQRNELKLAERQLKDSQARVLKVANEGESLKGAAHLVIPNASGKLPKNVISCSECYANNVTCDNSTRCRSCTERNTTCARWRCSLKQKLGECPMTPCKLPHDGQGWLITHSPRPQW